jgi:general secretion pathway protein K
VTVSRLPGKHSSDGFIVVAVLWILAAVAALVLVYASYVTNTAALGAEAVDRVRNEALVTAGLELTAYRIDGAESETGEIRPTSGNFSVRFGDSAITVAYRSEAARVDLNAAPKELLAGLFATLGASPDDAAWYADRILAWRAPALPDNEENDPENAIYRTAGLSYVPRHAAFQDVEELWLVFGLPPFLVSRVLPFVTVFSGRATVNIVDAAPEVVAALPGMTPASLQTVLAARDAGQSSPEALLALSGPGRSMATADGSRAFRVAVRVDRGNRRRFFAEVVILILDDADEPYRILSWRNVFGGTS